MAIECFCWECGTPGPELCSNCRYKYEEDYGEDYYESALFPREHMHTCDTSQMQGLREAVHTGQNEEEEVILKTLYKKNGDKVQKWSIEVEGNKFRTIEGFVDGAMTTSEWTVCTGKNIGRANETTPEQQAIKEAAAKNRKKQDSGYKEDIDCIHEAVPFEPMLAHSYTDQKDKVQYPCYVQPKLDGMRCPIRKEGAFSRQGKPVNSVPHIVNHLQAIFADHPGLVFDGELYNHELKADFNKLISIVKKTKPTAADLQESFQTMQFHVYDMYDITNPTASFEERYLDMLDILAEYNIPAEVIVPVKTMRVDSEEEMNQMYEEYLGAGYEGQMVRSNAAYQQKRTVNLLKRKEWLDAEFKITDIVEGVGNRSGMMGKIIMVTEAGESFEADGSGLGGHEAYVEMLQNKANYIGKLATVKYQNLTPDRQVPRFGKVTAIRDYE